MIKNANVKELPDYLFNTYQMLNCAFPNGLEAELYLPLLAALYDDMSDRNLAEVVAYFTDKDYGRVLNDVYRIASVDPQPIAVVEKMKQRLLPCGYEKWLQEE